MLHTCFPYSPQDLEKYCIFILREENAIPVGIFWVYLPQIIVLTPLLKICCYVSPSHTISSILAHLSFRNYDPQFLFTVFWEFCLNVLLWLHFAWVQCRNDDGSNGYATRYTARIHFVLRAERNTPACQRLHNIHQKVRSVQMIIICWLICYFSVKLGIFIKINVV